MYSSYKSNYIGIKILCSLINISINSELNQLLRFLRIRAKLIQFTHLIGTFSENVL